MITLSKLLINLSTLRTNAEHYRNTGEEMGGFVSNVGICDNVGFTFKTTKPVDKWLSHNIKNYPKFSGDTKYPVKGNGTCAAYSYTEGVKKNTLWIGEYGNNRMHFLNWMIEQMEHQVRSYLPNLKELHLRLCMVKEEAIKYRLGEQCLLYTSSGICNNVEEIRRSAKEYVREASLENWLKHNVYNYPDFSGKSTYPVKGDLSTPNPVSVYHNEYYNTPKWTGEYGNNRMNFLNWCIEAITQELEDVKQLRLRS